MRAGDASCEPMVPGTDLGWRKQNKTPEKLQIVPDCREGSCDALHQTKPGEASRGGRFLVRGLVTPAPVSEDVSPSSADHSRCSEHVCSCKLSICCRISITSVVNVFNFRTFSSEAAPRVCPGCCGQGSCAKGHPGAGGGI